MIKLEVTKSEEIPYSELIRIYQRVFSTLDGEKVLSDILQKTHFLSTSFSPDSNLTAFQEGERNVGLMILSLINTDPSTVEGQSEEEDYV